MTYDCFCDQFENLVNFRLAQTCGLGDLFNAEVLLLGWLFQFRYGSGQEGLLLKQLRWNELRSEATDLDELTEAEDVRYHGLEVARFAEHERDELAHLSNDSKDMQGAC